MAIFFYRNHFFLMPPEKSIPLEVPVPGKSESFTDKIRRATDWIFGREKKEIQNAGAEERAKLQESLKKEKLPQIVTEVQRARKEIMKSTLKEGVESVLGTLEDPRGQKYPFTFPRSINNSNTLTIPYIGGYRVTLLPIPKTNGYNSEFRIQAQKIGTNEPQEEWRKLAVRYTTSTPDYRILTQEIKKSEKKEETLDEQRQALIGEISLIEKKLIQKKPVLSKQSKAKLIARKRDINSSLPRIEAHLRIAKNEAQKVQ